jgi:hypothetical protein
MAHENKPEPDVEIKPLRLSVPFGVADYSTTQRGRFYANHASGAVTLFDIRLIFSAVHVDDNSPKVVADDTIDVLMSPELAALVHQVLGKALNNYRETFGKLRLPDTTNAVASTPKPAAE